MMNNIFLSVKKLGYRFIQTINKGLIKNSSVISPYGIKNNAPKNNLTLQLNIEGRPEKSICMELNDFKDEALQEGEIIIGNFLSKKNTIKFDKNGNIIIKAQNIIVENNDISIKCKNMNIESENVNIKGMTTITGDTSITGNLNVSNVITGPTISANTISSSGDINATGDIIAGETSLKTHTHTFNYNAGPTPASGNTNAPT